MPNKCCLSFLWLSPFGSEVVFSAIILKDFWFAIYCVSSMYGSQRQLWDQFFEHLQCLGHIPSEHPLFRFQNLVPPNQKFIHLPGASTSCKNTWDTTPVAYFGWIDLPIILCLWSPPTPIKVASNIEPCSRLEGTTTLNGREEGGEYFISQTWNHQQFNTQTYIKIHTPTVVQRWWGLMKPLPAVFYMLQYFETILPLVESLWSSY